jgi:hypothetical protein
MRDSESIQSVQNLLDINKRNLRHLENQAATYGGETQAPLNVVNSLFETRQEIQKLEERLHKLLTINAETSPSEAENIDLTPIILSFIEQHYLLDQSQLLQEIPLDSLSERSISQSNKVNKKKFDKPVNSSEIKTDSFSAQCHLDFRHSVLIEEKYVVENSFPYNEDIWKQISLGKAVDIKSYSPSLNEFHEIPIVDTLAKDFCKSWHGTGKLNCIYCEGIGEQNCQFCSGSGKDPLLEDKVCRRCEGQGKIQCRFCSGTGMGQSCERCQGSGHVMKFSVNGKVVYEEVDNFRIILENINQDAKKLFPVKSSVIWSSGIRRNQLSNFSLQFKDATSDYSASLKDWISNTYEKMQKSIEVQRLKGIPDTVYLGHIARSLPVIERSNATINEIVTIGYVITVTIQPTYTIKYHREVHYQTGTFFWKKEKIAYISGELSSDGKIWTKLSENVEREV